LFACYQKDVRHNSLTELSFISFSWQLALILIVGREINTCNWRGDRKKIKWYL